MVGRGDRGVSGPEKPTALPWQAGGRVLVSAAGHDRLSYEPPDVSSDRPLFHLTDLHFRPRGSRFGGVGPIQIQTEEYSSVMG